MSSRLHCVALQKGRSKSAQRLETREYELVPAARRRNSSQRRRSTAIDVARAFPGASTGCRRTKKTGASPTAGASSRVRISHRQRPDGEGSFPLKAGTTQGGGALNDGVTHAASARQIVEVGLDVGDGRTKIALIDGVDGAERRNGPAQARLGIGRSAKARCLLPVSGAARREDVVQRLHANLGLGGNRGRGKNGLTRRRCVSSQLLAGPANLRGVQATVVHGALEATSGS
jgi:hypothetical protein